MVRGNFKSLIWLERRVKFGFSEKDRSAAEHFLAKRASICRHESGSRRRRHTGDASCEHRGLDTNSGRPRMTLKSNVFAGSWRHSTSVSRNSKSSIQKHRRSTLRASALVVARQIDAIRCSSANELSDV